MATERVSLRRKKKKKEEVAFELQNDRPPPSSLELHNNGLCYVHLSSVTTRLNDIIKMGDAKNTQYESDPKS